MGRQDRILTTALAVAALAYSLGFAVMGEAQCPPGSEFESSLSTVSNAESGIQIAVADLNGDGLLDVAGVDGATLEISLQFAGSQPVFTTSNYALDGQGFGVAFGDFNRDGILDVAVTTVNGVDVFIGRGDGTFGFGVNHSTISSPRRLVTADLNGDGTADLVIGSHATGKFSVLIGNGDGTFQPHMDFGGGPSPFGVAVADVNGDGILDVVATCSNGPNVLAVILGLGQNGVWSGAFGTPVLTNASGELLGVVLGDVDGDGILDAVCSNVAGGVSVFRGGGANGRGDGTFPTEAVYPVDGTPYDVAMAKLTSPTRPDVIVGSQSSGVLYLRNAGDGTFPSARNLGFSGPTTAVAFADVNHDDVSDALGNGSGVIQLKLGACPFGGLPFISSFAPTSGAPGSTVTIQGIGFDSTPTQVFFAGHPAVLQSVTATQIVAIVPQDAETGTITVTTAVGSVTSTALFTVGPAPVITAVLPESSKVGFPVQILGQHLSLVASVAFGPVSHASFSIQSDTAVVAIVDTLAATGTVRVVSQFGTASSPFVLLPPDPVPHIASVRDVAHDQGGFVTVEWRRSDFDEPIRQVVNGYRVWRRAAPGSAPPASAAGTWMARPASGSIEYWELMSTVPAAFLDGYAFTSPTTQDSSAQSNPFTAFFVQALTAKTGVFYSSPEDSGYSVDNLAPGRPGPFAGVFFHDGVALHWGRNLEPDFSVYRLYRGSGDFAADSAHLVIEQPDTGYFDAAGRVGNDYKLAAVDRHGNVSEFAVLAPEVPTGTLLALASVDLSPPYVRLLWYGSTASGLAATVERRLGDAPWADIASITGDGSGELFYQDQVSTPGRYGYRLRYGAAGDTTGTTWVTVPAAELALAAWPNPAIGGRVRLGLTLLDGSPASLEVVDIGGRVVARRAIQPGSGGPMLVDLGGSRLAAGVYHVRLRQGALQRSMRLVVMP